MVRLILIKFLICLSLFGSGSDTYINKGCFGCHGPTAGGSGEYPRLAGKEKDKLVKKLKAYRVGDVKSFRAPIMNPFAKPLSDDEIEDLAEYLSKMENNKNSDKKRYEMEFEDFRWGDSGS